VGPSSVVIPEIDWYHDEVTSVGRHGIADGIMLSPKRGSKAMRLPPRPARCAYISVEQAAMESQGVGIGSQAVVVPLFVVRLSSEKAAILVIKGSKRYVKI
jgi:hypothetical protein